MDKLPRLLVDRPGCPLAMPAPSETAGALYCRLPGGRVRIPTPEERVRFCVSGRSDECPTLQRYIRRN